MLALALVLLGGGVLLSIAIDTDAEATVAANVAVNESAADPEELSAHNSPTLARDPGDPESLALASRIDGAPFGCELNTSGDGGVTWSPTEIPIPRRAPRECFAPDVAFGGDGTLYFSFVTLEGPGNIPNAAWVARSEDAGRTLEEPVKVLGPLSFQVRLAADPELPGRVSLSWLDAAGVALFQFTETGNPIRMISSDDGGRTWGEPVDVSDAGRDRVVGATPVAAGDDRLYVAYLDLGSDRLDYAGRHEGLGGPPYAGRWQLVLARSEDGGTTWDEAVIEDELVPTERFITFIPPFPSLVASDGGELHAGFQDGGEGDADVLVWSSDDSGATWDEPVRVNDTAPGDGTSQYRPQLAMAPDGRLDVLYYDRRDDPEDLLNEVSLQSSTDGGATFGQRLVLSDRAFDSRIGFGFERDLADLGSRLALVSDDDGAVAAWADTRGGDRDFPKLDIAFTRVDLGESSGTAQTADAVLAYGGAAVVLTGILLFGASLLGRRRADKELSA